MCLSISVLSSLSSCVCMCSIAMVSASSVTLSQSIAFLRMNWLSSLSHESCSYFITLLSVSLVKCPSSTHWHSVFTQLILQYFDLSFEFLNAPYHPVFISAPLPREVFASCDSAIVPCVVVPFHFKGRYGSAMPKPTALPADHMPILYGEPLLWRWEVVAHVPKAIVRLKSKAN